MGLPTLINDADAAAETTVSRDEFGTLRAGPEQGAGSKRDQGRRQVVPAARCPERARCKRAVSSPVRCRGPGPRTTRRVAWRPPARVAAKQAQRAQGGFSCLAPIHALLRQTRKRMDCYGNANAGVAFQPLSIISIPWQPAPQVRNLDQAREQMTARRLALLRARAHAIR